MKRAKFSGLNDGIECGDGGFAVGDGTDQAGFVDGGNGGQAYAALFDAGIGTPEAALRLIDAAAKAAETEKARAQAEREAAAVLAAANPTSAEGQA